MSGMKQWEEPLLWPCTKKETTYENFDCKNY